MVVNEGVSKFAIFTNIQVEPLEEAEADRVKFNDWSKVGDGPVILTDIEKTTSTNFRGSSYHASVVDQKRFKDLVREHFNENNVENQNRRILLCVHGINTKPSAWLNECSSYPGEKYLVIPVLWSTAGGISRYIQDRETSAPAASASFKKFLLEGGLPRMSIMAHSLGCYIVELAAAGGDVRSCFDNIFMVAADVRNDLFDEEANRKARTQHGFDIVGMLKKDGKVHVLYSRADTALQGVRIANPSKKPLGMTGCVITKLDPRVDGRVVNKDCTNFGAPGLGHNYFFHDAAVRYYEEHAAAAQPTALDRNPSSESCCQRLMGDNEDGVDQLGVEQEVFALADAIALKSLMPPFVVGIFGDWGSGKSFTFNLIKQRLKGIQKLPVSDPDSFGYAGHIYLVKFNIWTYAKGNLWAALMFRILVDLNDQLHLEFELRRITGDQMLRDISVIDLIDKLAERERGYLMEIPYDDVVSSYQLENGNATEALTTAIGTYYGKDKKMLDKKKEEAVELARELAWEISKRTSIGKVKWLINSSLRKYQYAYPDAFPPSIAAVIDAYPCWEKCYRLLWAGEMLWIEWLFLLVAVAVAVVVPIVMDQLEFIYSIIAPPVIGVLMRLRSVYVKLKPLRDTLVEAQEGHVELKPYRDAEGNLEGGDEVLDVARKLDFKRSEISAIQGRIHLIEGESLNEFVQKRVQCDAYGAELGVVHRAQRDLRQFSEALLSKYKKEERFPRGDPRIVLFVDDLDRCNYKQVVEMLEAVQLLVKTELFLVVIALDTRYVTRSLEKEYNDVLDPVRGPSGLDYLEKIIQIPYRVPPINSQKKMHMYLEKQMAVSNNKGQGQPNQKTDLQTEAGDEESQRHPGQKTDDHQTGGSKPAEPAKKKPEEGEITANDEHAHTDADSEVQIILEEILFDGDELELLSNACFVSSVTPRSAKRLANIFKIMKITWEHRKRKNEDPSITAKNACILLLALSASNSVQVRKWVYEVLTEAKKQKSWDWKELDSKLENLSMSKSCKDFVESNLSRLDWEELALELRMVESFSFPATQLQ